MTPKQKQDLSDIAAHLWRDDLPLCRYYARAIAHIFDSEMNKSHDIQEILDAEMREFYEPEYSYKIPHKEIAGYREKLENPLYFKEWPMAPIEYGWLANNAPWPLEDLYGNQ